MGKPTHTDHDRLFKELLEEYFAEFIQAFFPQIYGEIDFSHLKFLQQELFTDITTGKRHVVDLLAETSLKGEDGLILVHIENQAQYQKNFSERMFIYFSRLYQKFRCKILPVAVFSYDTPADEPGIFTMSFPFAEVLKFKFYTLELKKRNWRNYIREDNPVAAALLSRMGYTPQERVQVKLEFVRMLTRLPLNQAEMALLTGFFETYLSLNQKEEEKYNMEMRKLNPEEVKIMKEVTTSWHEKGRKEGREEGREEGQKELLIRLIKKRFPEVPTDWEKKIQELPKEKLVTLGEAVLEASSIKELSKFIE